ncbi:hypothetical protein MLIT_53390 [Mycolicibacterium litorale]|uniref:Uncharacterized protein n=1 Tax=Mycolicibacterium litorale TaxID=758802 RepID=A0AAD1IUG1_9MYCO|nr:hypothetical protein MLIT_53390 [Mycolicibacterium litorale]
MPEQSKRPRDSVNKIFGETLPETSADERDDRASEDEAQHDRWLRDNIPPHHD